MALIQMDFMSNEIQRWTTINVVLPDDVKEGEKLPLLVLLHGYGGNHTDWVVNSSLVRYSWKHRLAIVMPDGDNSYFLDFPERAENYEKFVAIELPELMRRTFPVSEKREETFVAGLSMGGGGAIRMALHYPELFAKAAGLSAGLTVEGEAKQVGHHCDLYEAYMQCKEKLQLEENTGLSMPSLFLSIGDQDPLLKINQDFHAFLEKEGIDHMYEEHAGTHNWEYWDGHIQDVLDFVEGK